ncbi:MAG: exodeoxyribonuclease VII large subunit [Ruminococcus sp.]|nr:exodeoxyribonuclease VII large subunit [Ruminococcus sp.]
MINPTFEKPKIITVSQLNYYVKSLLENDFKLNSVIVTGEISNLTDHYRSGHIYFSLKDEKSVIRAVMFAGNARNLKFKPKEGMKVIAMGRVSLYEPSGSYQLYVEGMQPDGIGELALAFEQLKKKLEEKGIFAKEHKKPIPKFPRTVGVITSPTGAALRDIENILTRRYPRAEIILCPTLVQGENAAPELVKAVNLFNEYDLADVIIIGRGGGSIEDLWAFNSEDLAYAIYASNIPVISAVGHETDFTICDFVSDLRAPTPSAAAELAVPDTEELKSYYKSQIHYLSTMMDKKLINAKAALRRKKSLVEAAVSDKASDGQKLRLLNKIKKIQNIVNSRMAAESEKNSEIAAKLEEVNPLSVLKRGYTVTEKDGKIITSSKVLKPDDELTVVFNDGKVVTKVKEV